MVAGRFECGAGARRCPSCSTCAQRSELRLRHQSSKLFSIPLSRNSPYAPKAPPQRGAARVFILFSFGFIISYLFRTVNSALWPDLSIELRLTAQDLGTLTSVYFLTFAAAQPFLGSWLDRSGPRRVEPLLLIVAAIGSVWSAQAETYLELLLGRALIGIGVSACLMAALKAMTMWFPKERLPLLNGAVLAIGGVGSALAVAPVEASLGLLGWRDVLIGFAGLTLLVAFLILTFVPERVSSSTSATPIERSGYRAVLTSPIFWRVAPLTMITQGAFMAVQGLWAGPFLVDVAGMDRSAAAQMVSLLALAMAAGYLLVGFLAQVLARQGIPLVATGGAVMALFVMLQLLVLTGIGVSSPLTWAAYGALGSSGVLSYAVLQQAFPPHLSARATTALTFSMFASAFVFQACIGAAVTHGTNDGSAAAGHMNAWAASIAIQAAALVWYVMPTYRRSRRHR